MMKNQIHIILPDELLVAVFQYLDKTEANLVCQKWYQIISMVRTPRVVSSLKKFYHAKLLMLGERPERAFLEGYEKADHLFQQTLAIKKALEEDPENALRAICERETNLNNYLLFKRLFEYHLVKPKGIIRNIWTWFGGSPIGESSLADPEYLAEVIEENRESLSSRKMLAIYEDRLPQYCASHYFFPHHFDLFKNLKSLKITVISGKPFRFHLKSIPHQVFSFTHLEHLVLQNHELPEVPESLGRLVQLRSLQLSSNQIEQLPASISNLTNLQHLELERNKLTSLPQAIGALQKLAVVWLSHNKLTTLPEEMGNCRRLKFLKLYQNKLTEIPDSFRQLTQLVCINLMDNPMTTLPSSLLSLPRLNYLTVDLSLLPDELKESIREKALRVFNEDKTFDWWDYDP